MEKDQKIKQDISIGKNIRILRKRGGFTQDQVVAILQSNGCDMSRSTYAKIESGIANIRVSELQMLKMIFKAEYKDFFIEEDISNIK